jgi:hypothetical protein
MISLSSSADLGGQRTSSGSEEPRNSKIITRYKLANPNNHKSALAKADELAKSSANLAKQGKQQAQTPDFNSPLTGRQSSSSAIRKLGESNIQKAAELMQESKDIRTEVSNVKKYLQSKASEPERTKLYEIVSKDGRRIEARIIDPQEQGFVIQKADGEFMLIRDDQLVDESLSYIKGVIKARGGRDTVADSEQDAPPVASVQGSAIVKPPVGVPAPQTSAAEAEKQRSQVVSEAGKKRPSDIVETGRRNNEIVIDENKSINGKSYLRKMTVLSLAIQEVLDKKYGIDPIKSGPIASLIAQESTITGVIACANMGRGQNFTEVDAASAATDGAVSRLMENQELIAAADAIVTGGLDAGQKKELQGIITSFGTAATEDERKTVGSNIDAFFMKTYGKQAYAWMDGARGRDMALTNSDVTNMLTGVLSTQVSGTVVKRGVQTAMDRLSLKDRAAMTDPRFLETAMMSFQGTTADTLVDLMKGGDADKVRSFLEERQDFMTDANGKAVSASQMMKMMPKDLKAGGKAFEAGVAAYRRDPNVKAGRSNEGQRQLAKSNSME